MKKGIAISIGLIVLGVVFECLHFATEIRFFEIKLWLLGIVSITLGVLGGLWYVIVPVLENRAKELGRFKKRQMRKK